MRILAQMAYGDGPLGGFAGLPMVAEPKIPLAQFNHCIERLAFQTLTLGFLPFGPGLLRDRHVAQKAAPVEADRFLQAIPAAIAEQRLEPRQVRRDNARPERDRFAATDECIVAQNAAQPRQRLTQVLPRLGVEVRAP